MALLFRVCVGLLAVSLSHAADSSGVEAYSPSHFATATMNTSVIKSFGEGYSSTGADGVPLMYLNKLQANSKGEQVVNRPTVEAMGLLYHNCSIRFQLYIGDGPADNYGGFGAINIGSGAECLMIGTSGFGIIKSCQGMGVRFQSQVGSTGTNALVNIGQNVIAQSGDLTFLLRQNWNQVQVDFITYNDELDNRIMQVKLNGIDLFPTKAIPWKKTVFNTGGAYVSGDSWSNKITFLGWTCIPTGVNGPYCYDNHIIKNVYYLCGTGPIPVPVHTFPPTPMPTPQPSPAPTHPRPTPRPTNLPEKPTPKPTNFPTPSPTLSPTPMPTYCLCGTFAEKVSACADLKATAKLSHAVEDRTSGQEGEVTGPKAPFSYVQMNSSTTKVFGDAYTYMGPDGVPMTYLNKPTLHSVGENVVNRPTVEAMGVLDSNCSIRFQLYIGGGEPDYGGFAAINLGAAANCLLLARTASFPLNCLGVGVRFASYATGTNAIVSVGKAQVATSPDLTAILRNQWVAVAVNLLTINKDNRQLSVVINGINVFPYQQIHWTVSDMNAGGAYVNGQTWSEKITFFGINCVAGTCTDNHIVKNPYYVCGHGPIPVPVRTFPPTPSPTPVPTPSPTPLPTPMPHPKPTKNPTPSPTLSPTPQPTRCICGYTEEKLAACDQLEEELVYTEPEQTEPEQPISFQSKSSSSKLLTLMAAQEQVVTEPPQSQMMSYLAVGGAAFVGVVVLVHSVFFSRNSFGRRYNDYSEI